MGVAERSSVWESSVYERPTGGKGIQVWDSAERTLGENEVREVVKGTADTEYREERSQELGALEKTAQGRKEGWEVGEEPHRHQTQACSWPPLDQALLWL